MDFGLHCDCGETEVIKNNDTSKTDLDVIPILLGQVTQILNWNETIEKLESKMVESSAKVEVSERKATNIEQDIKAMAKRLADWKDKHPEFQAPWVEEVEPKYSCLISTM